MIKTGGTLYISFPVSKDNEIHFNSQRVFKPTEIFNWPDEENIITLQRFDYVNLQGELKLNVKIADVENIKGIGCGIYTLIKH